MQPARQLAAARKGKRKLLPRALTLQEACVPSGPSSAKRSENTDRGKESNPFSMCQFKFAERDIEIDHTERHSNTSNAKTQEKPTKIDAELQEKSEIFRRSSQASRDTCCGLQSKAPAVHTCRSSVTPNSHTTSRSEGKSA